MQKSPARAGHRKTRAPQPRALVRNHGGRNTPSGDRERSGFLSRLHDSEVDHSGLGSENAEASTRWNGRMGMALIAPETPRAGIFVAGDRDELAIS